MSAPDLTPLPAESWTAYLRRVDPVLAAMVYDLPASSRDELIFRKGHHWQILRDHFEAHRDKEAVRVARMLTGRTTFDFGAFLLDPHAAVANADEGRGSGPKSLACRRCGESPMLNGIVTIRNGKPDEGSPLCEGCIRDLNDDGEPPDGEGRLMASIKVSVLVVEVRTAAGVVEWRRPASTQYVAGYATFNSSALGGDEAHELLGDDPAANPGVDIASHNYLSGIEATVVDGDVGAGVVMPFDLSDPITGSGFTFIIHLMLKKTASGTFPANVVVRLLRNTGSAVATFTIGQSTISYPAPGWHSITLTSEQVAAAMVDSDAHIAVEIANGIPA